jgi:hypothetical protein
MQLTLRQISGANGCHQQSSSYWDLQWTALLLASPPLDFKATCLRGVSSSLGTDQGHKDWCAKSRMFHSFSLLLHEKGPPQVLPHGSVQCHAVQVVEHLWWNVDASVALSDAGDSPETFSNTLIILCHYSLAIWDLTVVDNTFSITLPARFLVKFLRIMPFQFGLVSPCLGLIKGGIGKHHFCWSTVQV